MGRARALGKQNFLPRPQFLIPRGYNPSAQPGIATASAPPSRHLPATQAGQGNQHMPRPQSAPGKAKPDYPGRASRERGTADGKGRAARAPTEEGPANVPARNECLSCRGGSRTALFPAALLQPPATGRTRADPRRLGERLLNGLRPAARRLPDRVPR